MGSPDFDNAEDFVSRLVREGVLVRDPLVDEVIDGGMPMVGAKFDEPGYPEVAAPCAGGAPKPSAYPIGLTLEAGAASRRACTSRHP